MDFIKSLGGKIVAGLIALAVVAGGISWWQMGPQTRQAIVSTTGRIVAWGLVVLLVPWLCFWLLGWMARLQSNIAGAVFVLGLTVIEAVALAWLFKWSIQGTTAWTMYAATIIAAAAYNLFACDWIAEKAE